ncbi:MerR family transcriptional regulator [Anaerosporobacter faecicola]|uniref:MerR family transcriptional regulator n=1 Tax=Anaerosporobacter faecicola TaxID=2718714 RepID=UPI00143A02C3|nr:MerR family transcriptional regulator [Anaerosporobacter faecicola]
MYRIGEFSKMCRVSIKTLRYYDEINLLKPEWIDQETNYRFYTTDQLVRIHQIQSYRQVGMSIDEIQLIFLGRKEEEILKKRQQEIQEELEVLQAQLARITFIKEERDQEVYMNYHAVVKEVPEYIIYSAVMQLNDHKEYFDRIPALGEKVATLNPDIKCVTPEYCFIRNLDREYRDKDIHIEYCEAVDRFGVAPEGVEFKKIPSVTVVSVMHRGRYEDFGLAYAYAFNWIEKNSYIVAEEPRESYIDGIWNKEDEKEWLTEIQIPVIKKE